MTSLRQYLSGLYIYSDFQFSSFCTCALTPILCVLHVYLHLQVQYLYIYLQYLYIYIYIFVWSLNNNVIQDVTGQNLSIKCAFLYNTIQVVNNKVLNCWHHLRLENFPYQLMLMGHGL